MPDTISVAVTMTLNSAASAPPYNVDTCSIAITYDDGTDAVLNGWNQADLGTPDNNGATFSLTVKDSNPQAATAIQSWALTSIPRLPTTAASPFGNNANSVAGSAPPSNGTGTFALNL